MSTELEEEIWSYYFEQHVVPVIKMVGDFTFLRKNSSCIHSDQTMAVWNVTFADPAIFKRLA